MDFCPQLPALGQALPEFTANTTQGTLTLPADASGTWLVLFSHPADFRYPLLRHSCQLAQKRPYRRSRHCSPAGRRGRRKTAHEDLRRLRLVVLPQACVDPDSIPTPERSI